MAKSIAIDQKQTVYVDAESVSAIIVSPAGMTVVDRSAPPLYLEGKEADSGAVIKKLADQGFPLVSVFALPDGRMLYAAPSAFTFVTMFPAAEDGLVRAVVGIRGVGGMAFYKPPSEWQALLDVIGKKTFLEFESVNGGTANYPEKIYLDTKAVKAIQDFGSWARLVFENSASIELNTRNVRDMGALDTVGADTRRQLYSEFARAYKRSEKELQGLVEQMLRGNSALKAVPQGAVQRQTYLRYEDIADIQFGEDKGSTYDLGVRVKQERMDDAAFSFFWFSYPSKEDRNKAADQLLNIKLPAPKSARLPKPPSPK